MADLVDTIIEDDRWQALHLDALAERACGAALRELGLAPAAFEISLLGCDDARIARLNGDFRANPRPTNVLSWPERDRAPASPGAPPRLPLADMGAPPLALGDIAIAWETCSREALAAALPLADHVTHLLVHGALHLLGYDHLDDRDAALMQALEVATLAQLGLADPYERDRVRPVENGKA